jgi:hypothetical protein
MSEAAARARQPIDLEEFERRLRGSVAGAPFERAPIEPQTLGDYARLMNAADADAVRALAPPDPYAPQERAPMDRIPLSPYAPNAAARKGSSLDYDEPVSYAPQAPALAPYEPYPAFEPPVPKSDLAAVVDRYPDSGSRFAAEPRQAQSHQENYWDNAQPEPAVADRAEFADKRSRRPALLIGGAIVVCVVGIGSVLAMRGESTSGREAPTIKAASGPVKIQPEQASTGSKPAQSASILDRNGSERIAASRVVSREEQPIDVREAARAARVEPSRIEQAAPQTSSNGPAGAGFFPEPRKVKTVSVRPDGSIVTEPAARLPSMATAPAISALAPAAAAPTSAATPPVAKPAAAAPAPVAPKVTARATPPVPTIGDNAPRNLAPRNLAPRNLAAPVAASATPAVAAGGAGSFAVQLAAPGSVAEANSTIARLKQRYAAELSGLQPTTVPASVNGRDVYRVRVVGMSQDSANALCNRLKASGGSCFVARN